MGAKQAPSAKLLFALPLGWAGVPTFGGLGVKVDWGVPPFLGEGRGREPSKGVILCELLGFFKP